MYNAKQTHTIIINQGGEHTVRFATCACAVTKVRAHIWPSSPQHPAFSFDIFDWAESLLLECQVLVEDFCKAIQFKCQHLVMRVSIPLRGLGERRGVFALLHQDLGPSLGFGS